VGCHRRNLFVPGSLLPRRQGRSTRGSSTRRWPSATASRTTGGASRSSSCSMRTGSVLSPIPEGPFSCVRWSTRRASKQGVVTVGGPHRYSAGPSLAGCRRRRRHGRVRRHARRRLDRRGRGDLREGVGRRADGQLRPDAAAQAAVHAPGRLEGLGRALLAARWARGSSSTPPTATTSQGASGSSGTRARSGAWAASRRGDAQVTGGDGGPRRGERGAVGRQGRGRRPGP